MSQDKKILEIEARGKLVGVRPTTEADLNFVIDLENRPENTPFICQWTRNEHSAAIKDSSIAHLIIVSKIDNRPVGYTIVRDLDSSNHSIDLRRIVINDKNRGYGRDAIRLIKKLVFEKWDAHRLWLDVVEHNQKAFMLYKSEGFREEGMHRECLRMGDEFVSLKIMSVLRKEYFNGKNKRAQLSSVSMESDAPLTGRDWINRLLSERTGNMKANAIREILKVAAQPGMISMAGGLPAPESFPLDIIEEITIEVLHEYASSALQYGPTEGFPPLRKILVEHVKKLGIEATEEEITISSGSQGTLDAMGRIFISRGNYVAVESPTYLGALSAFNPYQPRYLEIKTDNEGVIPESLDNILSNYPVKFVYLIPNFQNPSGRTIARERRQQIADIIRHHNALLLEDDAYNLLRFRGDHFPSIKSLAPERVIYTSTFSKILSPGLRIGFCIAPVSISRWLTLSKQGVDLHTSSLAQAIAAKFLSGNYLDRQMQKIIDIYLPKLNAMLEALEKYFPDSFKWSKPDGGLFVWAEGPPGFDATEVYQPAIEKNVAFVPGKHFFAINGEGLGTMRLNFSNANEKMIYRGIEILGELIQKNIDVKSLC